MKDFSGWILSLLLHCESWLDCRKFSDISHYLSHSEEAIAFEYLMLEIMESNKVLDLDSNEVLEVARQLGLEKDYHFDQDFWKKLLKYFD